MFAEIDEEIRRERLKQLWDRYGAHAIAVALVIVLGMGGWRGYQWWEARQAAEAGAAFEAATTLVEQDKHAEAEAAFAKIAADAPFGYRILARFGEAASLGQRDPQAAVKIYDMIAIDSSAGPVLQDLANVRAGMLLADTEPYDSLRARLEPLTSADRAFRHTARELLAFAAWRGNNSEAAKQWIEMIVADAETPASTRNRIDMLTALTGTHAKG
ncbi:MAG: tetratricopeptide repeat protein [Rhizobiales bacterium]|nr:tetratricopeptide repeat protein [Hyphomicrobiales bacterium]